jgi:hypothetical protein
LSQNFLLRFPHLLRIGLRSIVKAVQMQKAVHNVQSKFARERTPERASVPLRCFDTDKYFTVLKREHIRRSSMIEKLAV